MDTLNNIVHTIQKNYQHEFNAFSNADFQSIAEKANRKPLSIFRQLEKTNFIFIAECKKASPSLGIISENYNPVTIAAQYQKAGANAISVLTEESFFLGSLNHLENTRKTLKNTVLLQKDFIIHPAQIAKGYLAGADMILLIAAVLNENQLLLLAQKIAKLGMTPLIEIYAESEIDKVLRITKKLKNHPILIGVNNRNLKNFRVNLQHSIYIKKKLPHSLPVISESGIKTHQDIAILKKNQFKGVLIGEAFLINKNPADLLSNFIKNPCS